MSPVAPQPPAVAPGATLTPLSAAPEGVDRVADLVDAQADRMLEAAAHRSQRADATRATASDQDAQADELYAHAARLRRHADQLRAER